MALTKQQRIYVSVLALAAGAWAVDRFVLRGGVSQPAGAQASSLLITPAQAPGPIAPTAATAAGPVISLNERLSHFAAQLPESAGPVHDVFSPPDAWLPVEKPTVAAPSSVPQTLADFRQNHPLTAIMRAGRNSQAFIGDRVVRIGETVDGFRLLSVTETTATFDFRGASITLELTDGRQSPISGHVVSR